MQTDEAAIRWQGYEHEHIEHGKDWFLALGITAACIAIISVIFGNVLFAILILVGTGTLGLLARTPPAPVEFEISDRGIRVGRTLHRYNEVLAFWVEDHETDSPVLFVDTTKWSAPNLSIPLTGTDSRAVRALLIQYAEEVPMKETLAHRVLEFLGL